MAVAIVVALALLATLALATTLRPCWKNPNTDPANSDEAVPVQNGLDFLSTNDISSTFNAITLNSIVGVSANYPVPRI